MGQSGDEFNANENDDDTTEESSNEDENNQPFPPVGPSSLGQGTISNALQGSQVLRHFLHWLGFYITLVWQWLLISIGTRIFGTSNRNRHAKDDYFLPSNVLIIMFTLFATIILITHTPMDIENRQTDAGAVPVNNDNFDDMAINDELGSQLVIMSASEAVDNRTYDSSSFISDKILNDTNSNLKIGEDEEITFSSSVEPYVDDAVETDSNSDNTHSITSIRSPISDDDDGGESVTSEISWDLSDFEDDSDEESIISPSEDNSDDNISDDTDGGYDTRSEISLSSQISNSEDNSIDDNNNERLLSDHGYQTNSEDNSINNDDERSLVSDISYEINNENDPNDDDDRWSDISHISYYISSDDDSIDDGYGTKSETDSLVDDENDIALIEIQNNAPIDEEVSAIELSIPLILLTGSTTEKNADLLPNLERPVIMSSMGPSNVEGPSSFDSSEEEHTSQTSENHARNMDPIVLDDIQITTDSNNDHHQTNEPTVDSKIPLHSTDENNYEIANNNRQDNVLPSSELLFNDIQNNEQGTSQTLLPDQSSTVESESDGEEMACSSRSMNMELQKRTSPAIDSDEESPKQKVK